MLVDKVDVVFLVLDEVVHDRQQHGGVRARADGHPDVGLGRRGRVTWVDHNQFGAVLQPLEILLDVGNVDVLAEMVADKEDDLGVGHVHVLVGRALDVACPVFMYKLDAVAAEKLLWIL